MARLFADENFPLPVIAELRRLGHDLVTLQETGKAGQAVSDEAVLTIAAADQRAVLTLNRRHFIGLHSTHAGHAGVIGCSCVPDFIALAERIDAAIGLQKQLLSSLIRINRPSS